MYPALTTVKTDWLFLCAPRSPPVTPAPCALCPQRKHPWLPPLLPSPCPAPLRQPTPCARAQNAAGGARAVASNLQLCAPEKGDPGDAVTGETCSVFVLNPPALFRRAPGVSEPAGRPRASLGSRLGAACVPRERSSPPQWLPLIRHRRPQKPGRWLDACLFSFALTSSRVGAMLWNVLRDSAEDTRRPSSLWARLA